MARSLQVMGSNTGEKEEEEGGGGTGLTTITADVFPNPLWLLCKANTCPVLPAECEKR